MSAQAGVGKLKQAAKDLRGQWNETRSAWRDDNARRFEEQYVTPLLATLRKAELTLAELAVVLQQARRDCE